VPADDNAHAAVPDGARPRRRRPLVELAIAFTRVGLLGFGGGPSFIPLLQRETQARGWLDTNGFMDALAFGNALPGPIATKLAGYVGFRVAGVPGAIVALAGLTVPTIVAIVALINTYLALEHLAWVQAALAGIRPVVLALVALVVIEFAPSALALVRGRRRSAAAADAAGGRRFAIRAASAARAVLALLAFAVAVTTDVHPGLLILAGGVLGVTVHRGTRRRA
jgi:chromate transporter